MHEPEYETLLELVNCALAVTDLTKIETVAYSEGHRSYDHELLLQRHYGLVRGFDGMEQRQVTMSQDMVAPDAEWEITSIEKEWNEDTQPKKD